MFDIVSLKLCEIMYENKKIMSYFLNNPDKRLIFSTLFFYHFLIHRRIKISWKMEIKKKIYYPKKIYVGDYTLSPLENEHKRE